MVSVACNFGWLVSSLFLPLKITLWINSCAGKAKIEKMSRHLKVKCELLDSARSVVWYFFHAYHCSEVFVASLLDNFLSHTVTLFSLQLEKNRLEQLEKFYPNFIYTQNLGLVRSIWSTHTLILCIHDSYLFNFYLKSLHSNWTVFNGRCIWISDCNHLWTSLQAISHYKTNMQVVPPT